MKLKNLIAIAFIASLTLACGKKDENATSGDSDKESIVNNSSYNNPKFIEKYNGYIGFGNNFHSSALKAYERYFKWADKETGPNAKNLGSIYTIPDYSIGSLEKALKVDAEIEGVDDLMQIVLEKAKKIQKTLDEADNYYDLQDYKEDDFKKGQELHKQIITEFDEYFEAYGKMKTNFNKVQEELFIHDVERYKKNESFIRYNLMLGLNSAEKIVNSIFDTENLTKLDLQKLDENLKKFRTYYDELNKLSENEEQIEKEISSIGKSSLRTFLSESKNFIRETKKLKERVEKNDFRYGPAHPSIPASGSPEKIDKVYSNLVNNFNRMQR